jgi:hypothetical protein
MKPGKWRSFTPTDSDREYLALLSYLPLKRYRMLPKFLKYTAETERQLSESEGLIGYSLQAEILSLRFWTLSVWENEESLMQFVVKLPHGQIMAALAPHMDETKFTRWKIKGASLPPSWNEAKKRMSEE